MGHVKKAMKEEQLAWSCVASNFAAFNFIFFRNSNKLRLADNPNSTQTSSHPFWQFIENLFGSLSRRLSWYLFSIMSPSRTSCSRVFFFLFLLSHMLARRCSVVNCLRSVLFMDLNHTLMWPWDPFEHLIKLSKDL